jgi:hypothetical protein
MNVSMSPLKNQSNEWCAPRPNMQCTPAPKMQCTPAPKCAPKCAPKKAHCDDPCKGYDWSWLGYIVLWFIAFTVIFYLIFYSLKPGFVLQSGTNQVDTAKVLLAAIIAAILLIIIVWLIKFAVQRHW